MALFAKISAYPPLASATVVPPSRKQFEFTVVVESSESLPDQPWEVAIWYDHSTCYATNTGEWAALPLRKADTPPTLLYDSRGGDKLYRHAFEGSLQTPFPEEPRTYKGRMVPFTVRYRINPHENWTWVQESFGISDGQVILQPPLDKDYLGAGPVELKDGWHIRKLRSEAPGATLYSFESSASIPYNADGAKEEFIVLGKVLMTHKWFALVRIWSPWLAPRHGNHHFHLNEPAILLSFLRTDGQHVVILSVNGIDDVLTTLRSDGEGNIMVAARNDSGKDRKFRILAASSYSFDIANSAVMYEMRKLVRDSAGYQATAQSLPTHVRHESLDSEADTILITNMHDNRNPADDNSPTPQWLASWYDSLSYCTWNSLGQDLNLEKIIAALQHFQDNKINIANMIIDDNWQSITGTQGVDNQFHRAMTDFEATPHCFPEGLKSGITEIRSKFPHLRDIAVWHALMGYWGCISADTGHLHKDYKLREIYLADGSPAAGKKYAIDPTDIHRFYSDFYTFLSQSGVTAVKTDVQFYLDLLTSTTDRREMTNTYLSAWTQAHLGNLSGKAISCMSQIPQILYHSFLPTNTPRIMLRNSDDFFPDVPTSHPWHVFANAHTALFVQHLNVLPDWDMFQTSHAYSGFHAAARCVSGGPIYITDYPGSSDINLIHQMTARNPRGDTVILRPSTIGKSISTYDNYNSGAVLKVGAYDGRAETGTGILGVFNVAERDVSFVIPITKIPGVKPQEEETKRSWVVRSHLSRRITRPITPTLPLQGKSLLQANLPIRGYDIWTCIPVHGPYNISDRHFSIAIIGLLGKMTGACALTNSRFTSAGPADSSVSSASDRQKSATTRLRIDIEMKALGVLGVWISSSSSDDGSNTIDIDDDLLILMKGKVVPRQRVKLTTEGIDGLVADDGSRSGQPGLIEIDTEGAWDDLGLEAGFNNEVAIQIYVV